MINAKMHFGLSGELKHALDHSRSKLCVTIPQLVSVVKTATAGNQKIKVC